MGRDHIDQRGNMYNSCLQIYGYPQTPIIPSLLLIVFNTLNLELHDVGNIYHTFVLNNSLQPLNPLPQTLPNSHKISLFIKLP